MVSPQISLFKKKLKKGTELFCLYFKVSPEAIYLRPRIRTSRKKQVDDIHIQRRRRIDGVIHRTRDAGGPRPVVADATAEDQHHPVDNRVVGAKNKDHHQFNLNDADHGNEQLADDALDKRRGHGAYEDVGCRKSSVRQ